jgi:addiction module HigA family antidote
MIPENRIPTHPGEVLEEEFLRPLGITIAAFARHLGVPAQRIYEVVHGQRRVGPETAWLLAQALGTTPEFWLDLQSVYDLAKSQPKRRIARLKKVA